MKRICTVGGCGKPHKGHGYCSTHWSRMRRSGSLQARGWRPGATTCSRCDEPRHGTNSMCRRCAHLTHFKMDRWDFEAMLASQGGGCAICGRTEGSAGRALHVDHDNRCCPGRLTCGACVRGILCSSCNTAIGLLGDSIETLEAAIRYLHLSGSSARALRVRGRP